MNTAGEQVYTAIEALEQPDEEVGERARLFARLTAFAVRLDRLVQRIGRASSWLSLILVLMVAGDVGAR